ncbi:hypothetical protein [Coleofasciculus chthonoplastes]
MARLAMARLGAGEIGVTLILLLWMFFPKLPDLVNLGLIPY